MLNLIKNEWMKIFKRSGTYVMIGIILFVVTAVGGFVKYQDSKGSVPDNTEWKSGLQVQNEEYKKQLEEYGSSASMGQIEYYERNMAINNYRIEHDITPYEDYSVWSFVSDLSSSIDFVGLFVIIIAAGIVASEFSWGTIKLLLIRPIKRERILVSKYITVLFFGLFMLAILFVYSAVLGVILFGLPENPLPYLNYYAGEVTEQHMIVHLIINYGMESISMLMLATMAFMISAAFRNSSLAIGLSIFLLFMGEQITKIISLKYEWAKYSLFANTNLLQYFEGTPMVEGMTLGFSAIILILYYLLFQVIAFVVFKKRDVAA